MLVFPQFLSGSSAQFPARKTRVLRTVRNVTADGSVTRHADPGAAAVRWDLPLKALTDTEAGSVASLFATAEGRLGVFTFLDPMANLFAWSGDFTKPAWQNGPMLQFTGGIADPFGGTRAIRVVNAGQAPQRISQTLPAPGYFQYCLSAYARSAGGAALRLIRSCASGQQDAVTVLDAGWRRCLSSGALAGSDAGITFAMEIAAGAAIDIYGVQAEAQPAASAYMESGASSGVYPHARFDHDELLTTAEFPDRTDALIRIVSPAGD